MRASPSVLAAVLLAATAAAAQPYGPPNRGQPGDEMIQAWLARRASGIHGRFLEDVSSLDDWERLRPRYREEYLAMLGLDPLPERTPLSATVTGRLEGDGWTVELLHYQSRPGLYVTANLWRPRPAPRDEKLPAVLYVCGHSPRGRNGNKTAFQSHGIWFARHGYVCLVVDTLQMGEIAALHHGTYREDRWWWHARGYTPAGVECWNGVRGIDYLVSRDDVDPERIGVTGISGGGAATFWIAAADERVKAAVPVSGMADLPSYVTNRVIDGHCDCMFLHNAFEWPWTRIAALVAPRPLLFVNSHLDAIFPMDANERVIARLERIYSFYGAGDRVDAVVSRGGHAYREDIRRAAYRFLNTHLKHDPRPVTDSEVDLVTGPRDGREHPVDPERLRVFPTDADIPTGERNTSIDRHFVPVADVEPPDGAAGYDAWSQRLRGRLRRLVFRFDPGAVPAAEVTGDEGAVLHLRTHEGIDVRARRVRAAPGSGPGAVAVVVEDSDSVEDGGGISRDAASALAPPGAEVWVVEPRGVGATRWTRENPPNHVRRACVLLGETVDTGRVRDVIAALRCLRARAGEPRTVIAGRGRSAALAAYTALLAPEVDAVTLDEPPLRHMDPRAPQFLNVLRVLDIPDALGLLAPRSLELRGIEPDAVAKTRAVYRAAGAAERLRIHR